MPDNCLVCDRISKILQNENPYFVAELETGYVVIGDYQFFNGYTLFLCKEHKTELHQLDLDFRVKFLKEISLVGEAVYNAFQPNKLNYECLGNTDKHLHWHIFPRYKDDPKPKGPVWQIDRELRYSEQAKPSPEALAKLKKQLLDALNTTASSIQKAMI